MIVVDSFDKSFDVAAALDLFFVHFFMNFHRWLVDASNQRVAERLVLCAALNAANNHSLSPCETACSDHYNASRL